MATSLKLVVLLCAGFAATAVFAQHVKTDFLGVLDEPQALTHNIAKAALKNQSVIFGVEGPNDRILYQEFVNVSKGLLQVKKKDITYPVRAIPNGPTITCIKVMDYLLTGKNAEFKVSSGGLEQKFVIINMRSKRGKPIMYNVTIYGR